MSDARITRPRRLFLEHMGIVGQATFEELKTALVGKGAEKMDITTLYRMIEIFTKQGIIHETTRLDERFVFLAKEDFAPGYDAIHITVCDHCGHVETSYTPLPEHISESITQSRMDTCDHCPAE